MIQPVRKFKDEKRNKIAFTEGVQDGFLNKMVGFYVAWSYTMFDKSIDYVTFLVNSLFYKSYGLEKGPLVSVKS